jgi:ketosteroid isomerase-like protein
MSEERNTELTRAFYDGVLGGKVEEAIAECMAPDVVWENPLPEPIPFGGTFQGVEGVRRYLGLVFDQLQIEDFQIHEIIGRDDRVVVLGSETSRVTATGRAYRMDWVHVLRVEDERIRSLREYNDTAAMLAAFR